jgi:N-acetylneuraminic acid mutarotase
LIVGGLFMRHRTLLLFIFLLGLGVTAVSPQTPPVETVSAALPQTPEAPQIATAAADSCSNATLVTLTGAGGVGEKTTVTNMTEGAEDPILTAAWGTPSRPQGYRTVWYQFTLENNGRVTIDTANNFNPSSYDTILAVYTGSCGVDFQDETLNLVVSNDDYQGFASRVTFNVSKDVTYYVEVADWNSAKPGTLELDIFFVLNPIQTKWESLPTAAPGRSHQATIKANGQIYMVGGQSTVTGTPVLSNELFGYDPGSDSWTTTLPDMPGDALTDVTAAYVNGRIYVPGGYNGNNMVETHNAYNTAADVWEFSKAVLPVAVGMAQAVALPDQTGYYLIGGISNTDFFSTTAAVQADVSLYTPDSWDTSPPDMNVPRYGHTAVWIDDGICVVGGLDDSNVLLTGGECYQPGGSTGLWTLTIPPMNIARFGAGSAVSPDGRWFVFGGQDGNSEAVPEVEVYDPANPGAGWQVLDISYDLGGFEDINGIPIRARSYPEGQFIGNNLYAIGGNDTTDYFVTPLVQRLLALGETVNLPVVLNGNGSRFNDNFGVAQRLSPNAAQIHQFDDSTDFFDAFYFEQSSSGIVTVRLSQIPSGSDYNITVYDDNKAVRGSGSNGGNQDEAVLLSLSTGRYFIMVERIFGQSDGSNYRIIVEQ